MQLYSFSDANLLNSDLADQIKNSLCEAITLRGRAYLVVSGGKTPVELFKLLAQKDLPWDKVTITLADERCVGVNDPDRNERLVKDFLLQYKAHQAQFISLYNEQVQIEENLKLVELLIDSLPTFDVVILGMGEDGHTASLFPCSDELESGLDDEAQSLLLVHPRTAPYQRITLSKRRLLNSRMIFIHLVGPKKRIVFSQALVNDNPKVMPISAFINNQNANIQVMYAPQ
ncbi:6-phosphogluconolactonase [Legionella bononiensis]|uniref:6-phosphogluconolactonase n=1 Tax=Legionella bononiensis TaxID=2793102 RepID=A0ABS1W9I0_9GAMM|nr:6-phosphogluconolactonase [Legionella bononiensis]MBL7480918.1 6-phosphogluconolactonase [Legionella bononiensis]MBL7525900.1 6-phosphogluconolactonase [Legionella bononiensis]MBL7564033.1 6-phosphogluconolactonase [Legionella bononiensis]